MKTRRKAPEITEEDEARIQAGIARDPDAAEPSDGQLAAMRPASEMLPSALYAALTRPRGRPKAIETKMAVKLRLDRSTVAAFKTTGAGWQTRMNDVLGAAARDLERKATPKRARGGYVGSPISCPVPSSTMT